MQLYPVNSEIISIFATGFKMYDAVNSGRVF